MPSKIRVLWLRKKREVIIEKIVIIATQSKTND